MRRLGRRLAALLVLVVAGSAAGRAVCGCAGAPSTSMVTVAAAEAGSRPTFSEAAPLARYHSARLELSLALPDGRAWRIDDHSAPALVATHAATRSRVTVAILRADELVGRARCEALARGRGLVPVGDLRTVEDDVTFTQQTFDTRVWVAIEPGRGPGGALAGHVMAFGGFLRKCFVFVYSTRVDGITEEPILSSRLAFARARVLGSLALDEFAAVPRSEGEDAPHPRPP